MGYRRRGRGRFEESYAYLYDDVMELYDGWRDFDSEMYDLLDDPPYDDEESVG